MQQFKNHLIKNQFSEDTIQTYQKCISLFLMWIKEENKAPEQIKYTDILNFIEYLKEQGRSTGRINIYLLSIRHYYDYLDINNSPAEGVILKGRKRTIPANLIEEKDLQNLYENYPDTDFISKRNKVITGLFIYQAISREELEKLKPEHLLLNKAKIIIPPGRNTNQRTLPLNAMQISDFFEYLQSIRPELMQQRNQNVTEIPNSFREQEINKLFFGIKGSKNLRGMLSYIYKTIREINPEIKDGKQIRMSVISNKLKTQNLREVQYFAGHKWVSSTERYKLGNIEDLKKEVDKFHPLN